MQRLKDMNLGAEIDEMGIQLFNANDSGPLSIDELLVSINHSCARPNRSETRSAISERPLHGVGPKGNDSAITIKLFRLCNITHLHRSFLRHTAYPQLQQT